MSDQQLQPVPADTDYAGPHAYDPLTQPQLFSAVIRKRCVAFIIDLVIITALIVLAAAAVLLFGVLTLGLGWLLFGIVIPAVWLGYNALTVGGPHAATVGQRMMGLKVSMWNGGRVSPLIAAFHALLFWFSAATFILLLVILLWALFDSRKRCLHDILAGVVVINRQ